MRRQLFILLMLLSGVNLFAQGGLVPIDPDSTYPNRLIPAGATYAYYVSPSFSAPYALYFIEEEHVVLRREYNMIATEYRERRVAMPEDFSRVLGRVLPRVVREADGRDKTIGNDGTTHYLYSRADGTAYVWSPYENSLPGALVGIFEDLSRHISSQKEGDIDLAPYSNRLELFASRLDEEAVSNEQVWRKGFMLCELADRETGLSLLQKAMAAHGFEVDTNVNSNKRKEQDLRQMKAIGTIDPGMLAKIPVIEENYANEAFCCVGTIPRNQAPLFAAWERLPEVQKALNPANETAWHLSLRIPFQSESAYVFAVNLLPQHACPLEVKDVAIKGNVQWFQPVCVTTDATSANTLNRFSPSPNTRPALLHNGEVMVILQGTKLSGCELLIENMRPEEIPYIQ